jgi:translation initiation factor 1
MSADVVLPGDLSNLGVSFDPLADSGGDTAADATGDASSDAVHIRVQQRNGRKSLTTVQGLKEK